MIMIKLNKFFKNLLDIMKNTNKKIVHIIQIGFLFSSFVCFIGIILLLLYKYFFISLDLIEAAMILFKTSILFAMQFLLCGFAFDKILKMSWINTYKKFLNATENFQLRFLRLKIQTIPQSSPIGQEQPFLAYTEKTYKSSLLIKCPLLLTFPIK